MLTQYGVIPVRPAADGGVEVLLITSRETRRWVVPRGNPILGKSPAESAAQEAFEEAGISLERDYLALKTMTFVPTYHFKARQDWDENLFVIPLYYFAVDVTDFDIRLSAEHSEYLWADYPTAQQLLHWDSDKTALWELDQFLLYSTRKNPAI